jgi:tetratricopeptide (TPR) repeat protein
LKEALQGVEEGHPKIILVEKETGATHDLNSNISGIIQKSDAVLWSAQCTDKTLPLFEQLLPTNLKGIVKLERPPRIEIGLIADKTGMNLGTVRRGDSSLDPDILTGMMDAVRHFVKDSLTMHTGESMEEGGFERFEMHGYNILVYVGDQINLTLILSGSIDEHLKTDVKRIAKIIEETFGTHLVKWEGRMDVMKGIEEPLSMSFFSSKKYEGEWDYDQLMMLQAKMFDETVKAIQTTARERPLALLVEDLEFSEPGSIRLLEYLIRNIEERKILIMASYTDPETEIPELTNALDNIKSQDYYEKLVQPSDIDVTVKLEELFPDEHELMLEILTHGSVLGTIEKDLIVESTGLEKSRISQSLEKMKEAGIITPVGLPANRSLTTSILSDLGKDELYSIKVSVAEAIEKIRPEDIRRLADLYVWLASENSKYSQRALEYARKMAEEHTKSFNLEGAVKMWLCAVGYEKDRNTKMEDLLKVIKLEFVLSKMDDLHSHAGELLKMANSENNTLYKGFALWYHARWFGRKDRNEEALETINQAAECFYELKNQENLAFLFNTKALIYNSLGKRSESLDILKRVLEMSEEQKNYVLKARALTNIAYHYMVEKDLVKAEEYLLSALETMNVSSGAFDKAASFWHLGLLYYRKGDYDESIKSSDKALTEATETSNWRTAVQSLTTLAAAYDKLGEYEKSEQCSLKALKISEKTEAGDTLALTYNMFDHQFRKQNDWLKRTIDVSRRVKAYPETLQELRIEILNLFGEHLELISEFIDSSGSLEQRKEIAEQLERLRKKLDV